MIKLAGKNLRGINNILQEIKEELELETVNEKHTDIINLLNLFFQIQACCDLVAFNLTPLASPVPPTTTAVAMNRFDKLMCNLRCLSCEQLHPVSVSTL